MDAMYPGSRFILTVRDPDSWFKSLDRHFGANESPMRELLYGVAHPQGNAELYKARMRRHDEEVLEYFKDRPDDLLVFDVTKDGNWPLLCGFLGEPIPAGPFPHSNSVGDRLRMRRFRQWGWLGRAAARIDTMIRRSEVASSLRSKN